jgi:hypothetical protein
MVETIASLDGYFRSLGRNFEGNITLFVIDALTWHGIGAKVT